MGLSTVLFLIDFLTLTLSGHRQGLCWRMFGPFDIFEGFQYFSIVVLFWHCRRSPDPGDSGLGCFCV